MLNKNSRVQLWYDDGALDYVFSKGTNTGTDADPVYFFSSIYLPVRKATADTPSQDAEYTYENIGLSDEQITECYVTQYGLNFFTESLDEFRELTDYTKSKLIRTIKGVLAKNKQKYLKLIELLGYSYNPLYNVDGKEVFTELTNHGGTTNTVTHELDTTTSVSTNISVTESTTPYDQGTAITDSVTTTAGTGTDNQSTTTGLAENNVDTSTITHQAAKNTGSNDTEEDYTANDTAYGQSIKGADYFHTNKLIRQGNIGVTKTTELIEAERLNLQYSLLQEFFDDINQLILVGIYDL